MSALIKVWEIPGGIHPPENKTQSLALPLGSVALPEQLILPLSQHIGTPAKPVVTMGEKVLGGQVIAAAEGIFSANVHAPTSGTISAIVEHPVPHASGMSDTCILLDTDGEDRWVALQETPDYHSLERDVLLSKIREAGIAGLGGAGFPAAVKLNPRANHLIDTLIINGTECEPYITADDMLMRLRADEIVAGTQILAHLLRQPKRVVIGVEDNKPEAIAALRQAIQDTDIEVAVFPTKYPSGGEKQLIQILTGREVPSGQIPASIGVVCQNVGTTAAIYRAIRYGEPLVKRITTVVGQALDTQRNIEVLLGTPIHHVLSAHGYDAKRASRVVMGGPMMGFTLPDTHVPVVKTTNCLLVPSKKEMPAPPPAQACIRCGMCAEACPASLLPQQLLWYAQAEDYDRLTAHNLFDCIECGACSYVCPSHIPLVQYYRAAKGEIRQHHLEREKADRSRRRFEFRQARITKEEAEKEAKRLARKQAAEEAKRQLAAQDKTGAPVAPTPPAVDPAQQRARIERSLAAARDKLQQTQQALEGTEGEHRDKLLASLKQTELKVREAEEKLTALPAETREQPEPSAADPVAAAIARAKAKVAMSPEDKLKNALESLYQRLAKAEEKAQAALTEGSDKAEALAQGVARLKEKIADNQAQLQALGHSTVAEPTPRNPATSDAASLAIEKAKARAMAQASLSPEAKLKGQIESLKARLEKSRQRLAAAEAESNDTVEALRTGVNKLEEKLTATEAQYRTLTDKES